MQDLSPNKRSIWTHEEVIIIKPLEVYCPVIKLISKPGGELRGGWEEGLVGARGRVWGGDNSAPLWPDWKR